MRGPETDGVQPTRSNGASAAHAPAASHDAAGGDSRPKSFSSGMSDAKHHLTSWWDDSRRVAHDRLELASLEVQRASESLITIAISALVALLLVAASWIGLMAALAVGIAELGLHVGWAILIVAVVNLIGAFVCLKVIKSKTPNLKFPATVASLKPGFQADGKEGM